MIRKTIWTFLLLLALKSTLQAQFVFTTNNGAITITGFNGYGPANIPPATNGYPVVAIASYGLSGAEITSVTVPNSVTNIGSSAFYECEYLTSAVIGGHANVIGTYAFEECPALTSVIISNGVVNVGDDAFESCASLNTVSIFGSVTNIGEDAFSGCLALTNADIGGTACVIGAEAFYGDAALTSVILRDGISSVGEDAFYESALAAITIPGTVINLGASAFNYCTNLGSLVLMSGVTGISTEAFYECYYLSNITFPSTLTSIASYAFSSCSSISNLNLPSGLTNLGAAAFSGCALTNVFIPAAVATIGQTPFLDCFNLQSISVERQNSAYSSSNGVLFDKTQSALLEYPTGKPGSYVIPSSVASVAQSAFQDSPYLTSIAIPPSVKTIGQAAFDGCTFASVVIPGSVTNIGSYAFGTCEFLTNVFFTGNPPAVGAYIFLESYYAKVFYLPGTSGWGATFANVIATLWNPQPVTEQNFGIQNGQFGFTVTGSTNIPIVIEFTDDLMNRAWTPLRSFVISSGSVAFSDSSWTNSPHRFYRISSP